VIWNKGLTAETDERVAKNARNTSRARRIKYYPSWNKGLSGNPDSPNYDQRLDFMVGNNNFAKKPEVKAKISKYMRENNPMQKEENRKKVSRGLKNLYASGYKSKNFGTHPSKKARENMSKGQRRRMKNNPEEWKRSCRKSGLMSIESQRKNKPYYWQGVPFMSGSERECAKLLLTKPIDGINCNVKINGHLIDFYPQDDDKMFQGKLVEFHPLCGLWDGDLTYEEYYKNRRKIIDNSDHKDIELIVVKNLEEIKNGIEKRS
jgi:hypothetical protein